MLTLNSEEVHTLVSQFDGLIWDDLTHHETLIVQILITHGLLKRVDSNICGCTRLQKV